MIDVARLRRLLLLALLGCASPAFAYPDRNLDIIVPFSAGGGNDVFIRALQPALERELGTHLVVRNLAGGGGAVGLTHVARLPADGYTLAVVSDGLLTQVAMGNVDFVPGDFDFVAKILEEPYLLAVSRDSPYPDLAAMIEDAQGGKRIKIGVSGVGSSAYLTAGAIGDALGIDPILIPFDGGTETVSAVMGGHIDAVVLGGAELRSALSSQRVRALATSYPERSTSLPEVPTFIEQGIDYQTSVFRGLAAPKGLEDSHRARLVEALQRATEDAGFHTTIGHLGTDLSPLYGEELDEFVLALAERMNQQAEQLTQ
ncbi:tripartite tricarboxylate transporter substrate binding protein [Halotalea alkalilenta]|uniref:ABC transporter substrate-binding protein n=1 Tax=Halotalea alkalilenta TaxID=376489 RepID=A0A172YBH1_9GAMM|nr:tripartite tricarboxylate transporter substrate binding protein [Halotalea alkalilenta]ANF56590.1 hypothetical protein A5892_03155 [Halotalea alkalilenta]